MKLSDLYFTDWNYGFTDSGYVYHDPYIDNSSRYVRAGLSELNSSTNINLDRLGYMFDDLASNDVILSNNCSIFEDIGNAESAIEHQFHFSDSAYNNGYLINYAQGLYDTNVVPMFSSSCNNGVLVKTDTIYNSISSTNDERQYKGSLKWEENGGSPYSYNFNNEIDYDSINKNQEKVKIASIKFPSNFDYSHLNNILQVEGNLMLHLSNSIYSYSSDYDYDTLHRTFGVYYGDKKVQIIDVPYEYHDNIPLNINFTIVGNKEFHLIDDDVYLKVENVISTNYKWTGTIPEMGVSLVSSFYCSADEWYSADGTLVDGSGTDYTISKTYYSEDGSSSGNFLLCYNSLSLSGWAYNLYGNNRITTSIPVTWEDGTIHYENVNNLFYGSAIAYGPKKGKYTDTLPTSGTIWTATAVPNLDHYSDSYISNSDLYSFSSNNSYATYMICDSYVIKSRDISYVSDSSTNCKLEFYSLNTPSGASQISLNSTNISYSENSGAYSLSGTIEKISNMICKTKKI